MPYEKRSHATARRTTTPPSSVVTSTALTDQRTGPTQPHAATDTTPLSAGAPSGQTSGRERVEGLGQSRSQSSLGSAGGDVAAQSPQEYIATAAVVDDSGWEEALQRNEEEIQRLEEENEMLRRSQMATTEAIEVLPEPLTVGHPHRGDGIEEGGGAAAEVPPSACARAFGNILRKRLSDWRVVLGLVISVAGVAVAAVAATGKLVGGSENQLHAAPSQLNSNPPTHSPTPKTNLPTIFDHSSSPTHQPTSETTARFPTTHPTLRPTPSPTNPPTISAVSSLTKKICNDLPSTCDDLATDGTPQSKALEWLVSDSMLAEYEEWRSIQRYVLATVAFSLEGWGTGEVVDWMEGPSDECSWVWGREEWEKIECDALGRVTQIGFAADLVGQNIPRDVALLGNSLHEFYFCCIDFQGGIPTEFGMLTNLQYFTVAHNDLSGRVPTEVGLLTNLRKLWLYANRLSGQVPTELGRLTQLDTKFLYALH